MTNHDAQIKLARSISMQPCTHFSLESLEFIEFEHFINLTRGPFTNANTIAPDKLKPEPTNFAIPAEVLIEHVSNLVTFF